MEQFLSYFIFVSNYLYSKTIRKDRHKATITMTNITLSKKKQLITGRLNFKLRKILLRNEDI